MRAITGINGTGSAPSGSTQCWLQRSKGNNGGQQGNKDSGSGWPKGSGKVSARKSGNSKAVVSHSTAVDFDVPGVNVSASRGSNRGGGGGKGSSVGGSKGSGSEGKAGNIQYNSEIAGESGREPVQGKASISRGPAAEARLSQTHILSRSASMPTLPHDGHGQQQQQLWGIANLSGVTEDQILELLSTSDLGIIHPMAALEHVLSGGQQKHSGGECRASVWGRSAGKGSGGEGGRSKPPSGASKRKVPSGGTFSQVKQTLSLSHHFVSIQPAPWHPLFSLPTFNTSPHIQVCPKYSR